MLSSIFGKTADLVDKRFLLGVLLPCFAFTAANASLVITACGWGSAVGQWQALTSPQRWLVAGGLTVVVFFFASVISSLMNSLIACWEGYTWPRWLRRAGVRLQRWRFKRLLTAVKQHSAKRKSVEDDLARAYRRTRMKREFPDQSQAFLPTRLGNALASAEGYSRQRYGLDSVLFWPRQYLLLSEGDRKQIDDARVSLDQLVIVATLAFGVGFVALFMGLWPPLASLFSEAEPQWLPTVVWIPSAAGSMLLGLLAYRAAVTAAVMFGDLVRSVSDLYRWDLVSQMNLDAPRTGKDEKKFWEALGQFVFIGGVDREHMDALKYSTLVDETIQVIGEQAAGGQVVTPPPGIVTPPRPPLPTPAPPGIVTPQRPPLPTPATRGSPWDQPSLLRCTVVALAITIPAGILVLLIVDTAHFVGW